MPETSRYPEGLSKKEMTDRLKTRYKWLQSFDDSELREISFCYDPGYEMQEGELYFDLEAPQRGVIRGQRGQKVESGHCYVSKSQLREETWKKLIQPFQPRDGS
ncbi:MAG: hypothetical protein ACUVX1_17220 [Chloroflexota bacterium]